MDIPFFQVLVKVVVVSNESILGKNHQILRHSAKDLRRFSNADNPIFRILYEDICADLGMSGDVDFGTDVHYEQVWNILLDKLTSCGAGVDHKANRWWSFNYRGRQLLGGQGGVAGLLLLFVYVGWRRKWWSTLADSPLQKIMAPS